MQEITIKESPRAISCFFASNLFNVDKTVDAVKKFITEKKINCNLFELIYILREALNNAVIHGNKKHEALQVECTVSLEADTLSITVADQGKGFDWRAHLRKENVPENALSGRGIHSMNHYGFAVTYNESGNTLYLRKKII